MDDQCKRLSKIRVVVNQDKKVLDVHKDVHMDPFAGVGSVPPAGSKRLAVKLS